MIDIKGKSAIVTGASRGIGAATARKLAQYGANVILAARSKSDIEMIAQEISDSGGTAEALVCDVTSFSAVDEVVTYCAAQFGSLDILVNNAGLIDPIARIADSDPAQWGQIVDINYKGVYHGLRAALPVMLGQGDGTIINISSGAATSALEGWSHNCSTKAAVLSLTRCADKEYREHGIRVHGLSPGTVATDMQVLIKASGINPVSRLDSSAHISPDWVGETVAWLCTEDAAPYVGSDFSIKTEEGRKLVGLS